MIFTSKRYPVRLSLSVSKETMEELTAIAGAVEAAVAAVARAAIEEGLPRVREAVKKQQQQGNGA